jgi:hypothetical protein
MAVSGDYGKPRPALVIQSNAFDALPSVTVLRLSSDVIGANLTRLTVQPTPEPTASLRLLRGARLACREYRFVEQGFQQFRRQVTNFFARLGQGLIEHTPCDGILDKFRQFALNHPAPGEQTSHR